jgi:hypothetical protein
MKDPRIIIKQPSIQQLNAASQIYKLVYGWEKMDKLLYELCKQYPGNSDPDPVFLKVELIDSLYRCNLRMNKLKITEMLIDQNLDIINYERFKVIDKIAELKPGHKRLAWVFASKYCHFHVPEKYPIIDSKAKQGLKSFFKKTSWDYYNTYSNFVSDLDQILVCVGEKVSYKEMDIYLYLLGEYMEYKKGNGIAATVQAVFDSKDKETQVLVRKLIG